MSAPLQAKPSGLIAGQGATVLLENGRLIRLTPSGDSAGRVKT